MAHYRSIRDLDWPLLLNTLFICAVGILQIYSAAHDTVWYNAWWKQALYVIVGFVVMWMVARIDYHNLLEPGVHLLCSVSGRAGAGAHRRPTGLRIAAMDPLARLPLTNIGVRQNGDNIACSPIFDGVEDRSGGRPGSAEVGRAGAGAHAAGHQTAGFGHSAVLSSRSGNRNSARGVAMAVCGFDCGHPDAGSADGLVFRFEGLSEGSPGDFPRSRTGSARFRLPGDPVEDCGRSRRAVGQGSDAGDRKPNSVSSRFRIRILFFRRFPKSTDSSALA